VFYLIVFFLFSPSFTIINNQLNLEFAFKTKQQKQIFSGEYFEVNKCVLVYMGNVKFHSLID